MKPIIEVKGLNFSYENQSVLREVNLEINSGDFAAFIGANGSGKTTLLKLILGLLSPDQGDINLLGKNINKFNQWSKIGYVSQQVKEFNDSFPGTVKEVVGANLYKEMGFLKLLSGDLEAKIDQALEKVDLLQYKHRQLGNLSGGQQQRVFIARTLVTDPEVIFLDEPLVGVDSQAQENFYQLLAQLKEELQITIVMISHDIHVISNQANKIVCFNDGSVFVHRPSELEETDYLQELTGRNKIMITEHEHRGE